MKRASRWMIQFSLVIFAATGLLIASPLQNGQQPHDDGCSGPGCPYAGCPSGQVPHCTYYCVQKIDGIHCHQECTCERK